MGLLDWITGKPAAGRRTPARPAGLRLAASSSFPRDVAGEGHYQAALSEICGGRCRGGHERVTEARLVPDTGNAYDPNAVRVEIQGRQVGFLPREDAAKYVAQLAKLGRAGETAIVGAKIRGGWSEDGGGSFGVNLGFTWPLRLAE